VTSVKKKKEEKVVVHVRFHPNSAEIEPVRTTLPFEVASPHLTSPCFLKLKKFNSFK